MTSLTIWDGITGIFGFLICIGVISIIYVFVAKLFNTKIVSRTGTVLAKPQDYDKIKKNITISSKFIIDRIRNREEKVDEIMSKRWLNKVEKLERLVKLKESFYISDEEFEILKKEILN
jgi:hypothetical protein